MVVHPDESYRPRTPEPYHYHSTPSYTASTTSTTSTTTTSTTTTRRPHVTTPWRREWPNGDGHLDHVSSDRPHVILPTTNQPSHYHPHRPHPTIHSHHSPKPQFFDNRADARSQNVSIVNHYPEGIHVRVNPYNMQNMSRFESDHRNAFRPNNHQKSSSGYENHNFPIAPYQLSGFSQFNNDRSFLKSILDYHNHSYSSADFGKRQPPSRHEMSSRLFNHPTPRTYALSPLDRHDPRTRMLEQSLYDRFQELCVLIRGHRCDATRGLAKPHAPHSNSNSHLT